jgi:hypothetical protein
MSEQEGKQGIRAKQTFGAEECGPREAGLNLVSH